jgi:hypothetical protein
MEKLSNMQHGELPRFAGRDTDLDPAVLAFSLRFEQAGYSGPRFLENV